MDPTTTLFTFMLQTHFSVRSVHLVGSWDNFSKPYAMERDTRRDRGQWRGCYSFKDITCDGEQGANTRRDGGLKMGQTYYYYYEVDGTTETHNKCLPSTNKCPYMPGQTVNTLWVPIEQSLRKRRASVNSMRDTDLMTMDPKDKFVSPRPAPSPVPSVPARRLATAPDTVVHKRSARSISPNPSWSFSPRKLFSRKVSSSSLRDSEEAKSARPQLHITCQDMRDSRAATGGSRSRDISPESLRRFLCEDAPLVVETNVADRPTLAIPDDIAEENEDDDNFATSATLSPLESTVHFTVLSPPPSQHAHSRCGTPSPSCRDGATTPMSERDLPYSFPLPPSRTPPQAPQYSRFETPSPRSSTSFYDPDLMTPASPESTGDFDIPSFYNSDEDDEDDFEDDAYPLPSPGLGLSNFGLYNRGLRSSLSAYSLPLTSDGLSKSVRAQTAQPSMGSPELVAKNGNELRGNASLLASSVPQSGLGELVSELGWMADFIQGKTA